LPYRGDDFLKVALREVEFLLFLIHDNFIHRQSIPDPLFPVQGKIEPSQNILDFDIIAP
jgi:hypothetical protein